MAIRIHETFQVAAPTSAVWRFVMDPHKVAACMPGAQLEKVLDEQTFVGSIRVAVGAITARYEGKVTLEEVDAEGFRVLMRADGREAGGGTARGTIQSRLRPLPEGGTEIVTEATLDLTGRVMQVGRGMIQGVAGQLFRQFVERTRERLEGEGPAAGAPPAAPEPIRIVPLILRTVGSAIARFFRRWFRRGVA